MDIEVQKENDRSVYYVDVRRLWRQHQLRRDLPDFGMTREYGHKLEWELRDGGASTVGVLFSIRLTAEERWTLLNRVFTDWVHDADDLRDGVSKGRLAMRPRQSTAR